MVEPAIELGMVSIVGEYVRTEQQRYQRQSLHRHVSVSSRFLFVLETTLRLQATGVLLRNDALVHRASLSNETSAFEITLRDKLNDLGYVCAPGQDSRRCHDDDHAISL